MYTAAVIVGTDLYTPPVFSNDVAHDAHILIIELKKSPLYQMISMRSGKEVGGNTTPTRSGTFTQSRSAMLPNHFFSHPKYVRSCTFHPHSHGFKKTFLFPFCFFFQLNSTARKGSGVPKGDSCA